MDERVSWTRVGADQRRATVRQMLGL